MGGGVKTLINWVIQAPWGTIYKTNDLWRFMSGRPDFFPEYAAMYANALKCVGTLAGESVGNNLSFTFADGWRVLDHSGRHAEIAEAAVSFPARLTWVVIQSPSGGKYRVGDIHRFEREKGLSQACGNALVAAIKRGIGKQQWPSPTKDGWTILRPMEASEFRVIIDPQNVHYVFRSAPAKKLPSIKGSKAKANAEWTLCDGYGYAYKTRNLRLFLMKRSHIFPDADLAYTRLKQIIEMRCGTRSGSLILSNGWTAIDRSDVHDLIYNGPPGAEAAPEMPSTPGVCIICGKRLDKRRWKYCSEACEQKAWQLRDKKHSGRPQGNPDVRWLTHCIDCGKLIYRPIKCIRCEACQLAINQERHKEHQRAKPARPLGSTDICTVCGKPYIVESGLQKYCPDCREAATRASIARKKNAYMAKKRKDPEAAAQMREAKQAALSPSLCATCGKPFISKFGAIYCCEACRKEGRRKYDKTYDSKRVRKERKD